MVGPVHGAVLPSNVHVNVTGVASVAEKAKVIESSTIVAPLIVGTGAIESTMKDRVDGRRVGAVDVDGVDRERVRALRRACGVGRRGARIDRLLVPLAREPIRAGRR